MSVGSVNKISKAMFFLFYVDILYAFYCLYIYA